VYKGEIIYKLFYSYSRVRVFNTLFTNWRTQR